MEVGWEHPKPVHETEPKIITIDHDSITPE